MYHWTDSKIRCHLLTLRYCPHYESIIRVAGGACFRGRCLQRKLIEENAWVAILARLVS